MRDIKFRAWDIERKKMFYSVAFDIIKSWWYRAGEYSGTTCGKGLIKIFHESPIMQYTGLKDKNGVEIYEGDILNNGDMKILYVVEWIDTGLMARQVRNKSSIGMAYWKNSIEIIGNIHQNPELLK